MMQVHVVQWSTYIVDTLFCLGRRRPGSLRQLPRRIKDDRRVRADVARVARRGGLPQEPRVDVRLRW